MSSTIKTCQKLPKTNTVKVGQYYRQKWIPPYNGLIHYRIDALVGNKAFCTVFVTRGFHCGKATINVINFGRMELIGEPESIRTSHHQS